MTRDDIDKLFGSQATDENLKLMGENWTEEDATYYLIETGYDGNPSEIIEWLREFVILEK